MLPKLQDIRWIAASPEHIELMLPLIVSPTLANFRLGLDVLDPLNALQVVPALEALAPAYNSLVEIRICDPTLHDPRIVHAASSLLLNCNPDKLRYFHVDSALSTEAFIHATQLPNLEQFINRTDTTELGIPLPTSTFPSLEFLRINATDARSPLLQTITRIQSNIFTTLDLEFPATTIGTFLPTTLAALRPRGLHQTLTRLSVTPEGDFDLDGTTIQPLLFLTQLTTLEIGMVCGPDRCPYKLSDADLEELVKAMPKLQLLSLGPIPCSHPANSTMKSLTSIAKHCGRLEELVIHTNIEAIVAGVSQRDGWGGGATFGGPISACPLRRIIFGTCSIPDGQRGAMTFALALLRLFPRLVAVMGLSLTHELRDPQWDFVDDVIATDIRIRIDIAAAGKFPSLHRDFAHVLQPMICRSTKCRVGILFLGSPVSRTPLAFYFPSDC